MHLRAKPPVFVPEQYRDEIERLSKAALMDMVWDMAQRLSGLVENEDIIIGTVRDTAEIILTYREREPRHGGAHDLVGPKF